MCLPTSPVVISIPQNPSCQSDFQSPWMNTWGQQLKKRGFILVYRLRAHSQVIPLLDAVRQGIPIAGGCGRVKQLTSGWPETRKAYASSYPRPSVRTCLPSCLPQFPAHPSDPRPPARTGLPQFPAHLIAYLIMNSSMDWCSDLVRVFVIQSPLHNVSPSWRTILQHIESTLYSKYGSSQRCSHHLETLKAISFL